MPVHVLDWDRCLVLGAGLISSGPRDPSLLKPDRGARTVRAKRMHYLWVVHLCTQPMPLTRLCTFGRPFIGQEGYSMPMGDARVFFM